MNLNDAASTEATKYGILIARMAEMEARLVRLEEIAEVLPPRVRQAVLWKNPS